MAERVKLTKLERYSLSLQLRILEALYPDEANSYATTREAIEHGYEMLYGWGMENIYEGSDVMSESECGEVWDTLEMFDALDRAEKRISDPEISNHPFVRFLGYDGNNESKFMAFAKFTMDRLKRFDYLPMEKDRYWNSHMPVRNIYGRMLAEWRRDNRSNRLDLSRQDVDRILGAAAHPDRRESL